MGLKTKVNKLIVGDVIIGSKLNFLVLGIKDDQENLMRNMIVLESNSKIKNISMGCETNISII